MAVSRFRLHQLVYVALLYFTYRYFFSSSAPPIPTSLSFCPYSTTKRHLPTVILQADGTNRPDQNRTYWVGGSRPANFLPFAYPPRELKFAQTTAGTLKQERVHHGQGNLRGSEEAEEGLQLCKAHRVPSSPPPPIPKTWNHNKVMFGMSTTPDRVLYNLQVWSHWLPAHNGPLDPASPETKDLPLVLVLTPPPNPTEVLRTVEAVDEAQVLGMFVEMRKKESDRFETRYFSLVQELWVEATKREKEKGIKTEWFIFADDDTFYPDYNSLVRLLAKYDPNEDHLIGSLSESTKQVKQWGHLAYGGASIIVSRSLVEKMNAPGAWDKCLEKYGSSFGGDAMISHCSALVQAKTIEETLEIESTLHQLDIRGDATGWFQSGFLITSLHHWGSWYSLFPPWHESGSGDLRKGITLVGKASKAVGGDNWGRRYVFEDGKVVVNLGYSISVDLKPLTEAELDQSEHTWWEFETYHPTRPGLPESVEKRTYYLTAVRGLDKDVVRLEHKNREGDRVDVLWDGRGEKLGGWKSWNALAGGGGRR